MQIAQLVTTDSYPSTPYPLYRNIIGAYTAMTSHSCSTNGITLSTINFFFLVSVLPEDHAVSYPSGAINFFCLSISSPTITGVEWMLNNTFLNEMEEKDMGGMTISQEFSAIFGGTLRFLNVSEVFNNTVIRCRATVSTGDSVTSNDVSILLLQGIIAIYIGPLTMYVTTSVRIQQCKVMNITALLKIEWVV